MPAMIPTSPSISDPMTAKNSICSGLIGRMPTTADSTMTVPVPTTSPRVTAPAAYAKVSSPGPRGGIRTSTILPWILPVTIDEEVLAKEFCRIAIITRPGTRNTEKLIPSPISIRRSSASVNTARNIKVVTIGAETVWLITFRNRRTSLAYSVHTPIQFTPVIRRGCGVGLRRSWIWAIES